MKKSLIFLVIIACIMSFCCYPITALSGNNTTKSNNVEQLMTFVGHRVVGNYSVSEALDLFTQDMNSLIVDYLFDGDVELAKVTMDNALLESVVPNPYIDMERFFNEDEWCISDKDETLWIQGAKIDIYIHTEYIGLFYGYTKCMSHKGEYYIESNEYSTRYIIDLGNNMMYMLDIRIDAENKAEKIDKLLEYGFMLRNLVIDKWQESTEAPTEAPTETASCGGDTESTGCGSTISGSTLILVPITAIGAFCVSKRKKKD